jgi:hypothetical protein
MPHSPDKDPCSVEGCRRTARRQLSFTELRSLCYRGRTYGRYVCAPR